MTRCASQKFFSFPRAVFINWLPVCHTSLQEQTLISCHRKGFHRKLFLTKLSQPWPCSGGSSVTFNLQCEISHGMVWAGRGLKAHPVPWAETPSTIPGCSNLALNTSRDGAATAALATSNKLNSHHSQWSPQLCPPLCVCCWKIIFSVKNFCGFNCYQCHISQS